MERDSLCSKCRSYPQDYWELLDWLLNAWRHGKGMAVVPAQ
jgi:hypothetical protein